jgi:hypothetical protein
LVLNPLHLPNSGRISACVLCHFLFREKSNCLFRRLLSAHGNVAESCEEISGWPYLIDPRARSIVRKTAQARCRVTFPEAVPVKSYAEVNPLHEGMLVENDRHGVAIVPGEAKTASSGLQGSDEGLGEKDR